DSDEPATYEIVAGGTIYIHGDANRSNTADATDPAQDVPDEPATGVDPGWGTNMHFAGRVGGLFDPVLLGGAGSTDKTELTLIFGNFDVDYFDFDHTFLGAKTRVFGSDNEIAQDAGPAGDGEDLFVVDHLQTMAVDQGDTLMLDGQANNDVYRIFTEGSLGAARNYVISVLDTGARAEPVASPDPGANADAQAGGADVIAIYGFDSTDDAHRGVDAQQNNKPYDDIFLLRSVTAIGCVGPDHCTNESTALRPAFVAVLHTDIAGARGTTDVSTGIVTTGPFAVERINYSADDNGRLQVYGLGGNDLFAVDDNSAITTLDGGADNDTFQIGQIYGLLRSATNVDNPNDAFATIATTRGYLSEGTSAPLVAEGGDGDDAFTVYSNHAELRLEGDDGSDLFVVRGFALAETNPDGTIRCQTANGQCATDGSSVAVPKTTGGFSTAEQTLIRGGQGSDQVSYNINAPVSVDGGNGFDKVVVLGTEFADHIVVTDKAIFGAGLNVRYTTVEVVEVDGLEGDDQFFVQSTAFGVLYRVIGGLGSDTINVASSVTADIQTRELEGASGAINHLVQSTTDSGYDGLPAPGIDYNVATPASGGVVITEVTPTGSPVQDGTTIVREGGLDINGTLVFVDRYLVHLAAAPLGKVYVTVSAACAVQNSTNGTCLAVRPVGGPVPAAADTILLASGFATPSTADFYRTIQVDGAAVWVPNRTLVLVFDASNWQQDQTVWLTAVNDLAAEGPTTVTISHSVIAPNDRFDPTHPNAPYYDNIAVRNVEVTVLDNDQAGLVMTQLDTAGNVDISTVVIEGTAVTQQLDSYRLTLAKELLGTSLVKVQIDASTDGRLQFSVDGGVNWVSTAVVTFDSTTWKSGIVVKVRAVNDFVPQDPQTSVLKHTIVTTPYANQDTSYNAVAQQLLAVDTYDDDTPNVVVTETGGSTVLLNNGLACSAASKPCDSYTIRLTEQPAGNVTVAIVGDGQANVSSINGVAVTPAQYAVIGGIRHSTQFTGNVDTTATTITRGAGSELGSFTR
ncbi:MAG: hypothetical protein ACJ74I_02620, partial [Gaiellaceae bacterium]